MSKKIKISLSLFLVFCLAFAAMACTTTEPPAAEKPADTGTTEPAAPTKETAPTDTEIVVAGVVFQDDQFMNMLTKGYVDAATAMGAKCLTENTNNDQAREVELINTYVGQNVAGIAIAPLSSDASIAALKDANAQGVQVAITNLNLEGADFIAGGFCSDDFTNCKLVGTTAAEAIKAKFPNTKVKVAIVQFKSLLPEQSGARVDGYRAALDEAGIDYEVVADQDAWMQDTALETAGSILTANPDLNVIITVNDGGTIGSTMAVVNAGLADKVLVFGHDGSDQISSMILDAASPLYGVVTQDPYGQGYSAMTALIKAIKGEDVSDTKGKVQFVPGTVLSKSDLDGVNKWRADNGL